MHTSPVTEKLWSPSQEYIKKTNFYKYQEFIKKKHNIASEGYDSLHQWSISYPDLFWQSIWDFCGVIGENTSSRVLVSRNKSFIDTVFFPDAYLNYAENMLRRKDNCDALIFWAEDQIKRQLKYKELYDQVSQMQQFLQQAGLKPGEVVASYLPNMPETIVCMLAVTSLGGVWSSCSPDFGVTGALDRFEQIEPKIFITSDAYIYREKIHTYLEKTHQVIKALPSVRHVIGIAFDSPKSNSFKLSNTVFYKDILTQYTPAPIQFKRYPFNHPLFILFSSGTTGKPKCIVHGAGGTLLQHLKEHQLHCDIKPKSRFFYYTTCGWMMWNWQVSALASGATLLLYDGSPFHPRRDILLEYAAQQNITHFGTGSKYIDALKKFKVTPVSVDALNSLKFIFSTGGPLVAESFQYVYQHIKKDICLSSISGGTDIISCFVLGCPILDVFAGEIQCKGLGLDIDIFDPSGTPVCQRKGELVCKQPFPSKPLYFIKDPKNKKYEASYFHKYTNIWCHGDFAAPTLHKGIIIYGRSDTTLNPGGIRIGTAEIYKQVEQFEEIVECIAVGQEWRGDIRIILFIKMKEGCCLTSSLNQTIKNVIRNNTTSRHVPAQIIPVPDLPRTRNGKLLELAVREVIHKRPLCNQESIANPECLTYFENLEELTQ